MSTTLFGLLSQAGDQHPQPFANAKLFQDLLAHRWVAYKRLRDEVGDRLRIGGVRGLLVEEAAFRFAVFALQRAGAEIEHFRLRARPPDRVFHAGAEFADLR